MASLAKISLLTKDAKILSKSNPHEFDGKIRNSGNISTGIPKSHSVSMQGISSLRTYHMLECVRSWRKDTRERIDAGSQDNTAVLYAQEAAPCEIPHRYLDMSTAKEK